MTPNEILFQQASPDKVMPIYHLWRAIWRFVFDEAKCPPGFRKEIEKEVLHWSRIIAYQNTIRKNRFGDTGLPKNERGKQGNIIDELDYQNHMMAKVLVDNEQGYWDYHKDTLRIHNIDYRKSIHCNEWFPEVQDPDRFKRGIANLKAAKEENPEDYANPTG